MYVSCEKFDKPVKETCYENACKCASLFDIKKHWHLTLILSFNLCPM